MVRAGPFKRRLAALALAGIGVVVVDNAALAAPEEPGQEAGDPAEAGAGKAPVAIAPITLEDVRAQSSALLTTARPLLRRAARTSAVPEVRAEAVKVLVLRDPTRATARICARLVRIDPSPLVRRKAAECLGRLPMAYGQAETSALVAALDDPHIDVVAMAGWALANVGSAEALGPLVDKTAHKDPRVAALFRDNAERHRRRHGLTYVHRGAPTVEVDLKRVPPPTALIAQRRGLETAASVGWLAVYGASSGWLHGGMLTATFGGGAAALAPVAAMGGALIGGLGAGAYGFLEADDLVGAHAIVQLGTMGTLVGWGAGTLSADPPASGINRGSFGFVGGLLGTGLGVALQRSGVATPGALALGSTVGLGSALAFGTLAASARGNEETSFALAMFGGGGLGLLTTLAAAPVEVGLFPSLGAGLGAAGLAAVAGLAVGTVESVQLVDAVEFRFTQGSGWAIAAGVVTGAFAGGVIGSLVPREWDPILMGRLRLAPPSVAFIPGARDPREVASVVALGGVF